MVLKHAFLVKFLSLLLLLLASASFTISASSSPCERYAKKLGKALTHLGINAPLAAQGQILPKKLLVQARPSFIHQCLLEGPAVQAPILAAYPAFSLPDLSLSQRTLLLGSPNRDVVFRAAQLILLETSPESPLWATLRNSENSDIQRSFVSVVLERQVSQKDLSRLLHLSQSQDLSVRHSAQGAVAKLALSSPESLASMLRSSDADLRDIVLALWGRFDFPVSYDDLLSVFAYQDETAFKIMTRHSDRLFPDALSVMEEKLKKPESTLFLRNLFRFLELRQDGASIPLLVRSSLAMEGKQYRFAAGQIVKLPKGPTENALIHNYAGSNDARLRRRCVYLLYAIRSAQLLDFDANPNLFFYSVKVLSVVQLKALTKTLGSQSNSLDMHSLQTTITCKSLFEAGRLSRLPVLARELIQKFYLPALGKRTQLITRQQDALTRASLSVEKANLALANGVEIQDDESLMPAAQALARKMPVVQIRAALDWYSTQAALGRQLSRLPVPMQARMAQMFSTLEVPHYFAAILGFPLTSFISA